MNTPTFFQWLSQKYPSVTIECIEKQKEDASAPNPNGVEFDNLYLDMNGIIHSSTHPEDKPQPKNEDEMMVSIFECIDRLFNIVRPRKVLYMAIDGVAPRAKMNQQRSGTPFMDKLSKCLQYYVHDRLNNCPAWKGIKVVLSDANVPGEGKHKIMDYIRKQRPQPNHDPNTQHVLCGADADLIMLGLATHEPNFTIIREEFPAKDCNGQIQLYKKTNFIFVRLCVLKEYLERELEMPNLPFTYEFERAVDDWVFLCLFVSNDFLPHLPCLEIREDAIDRLVNLYKKCVYKTGEYLTDSGEVALERVEMIMVDLGYLEDEIFKNRQITEYRENSKRRKLQEPTNKPDHKKMLSTQFMPTAVSNVQQKAYETCKSEMDKQSPGQKRGAEEPEANDEVRLWENGFKDRYYQLKFGVEHDDLMFRNTVALEYVRGLCWVLKYYYQGCASWSWYFPYHYAPFASDFLIIRGLGMKFDRNPVKGGDDRLFIGPGCSGYKMLTDFYKIPFLKEFDIVIDGVKCTVGKNKENVGINGTLKTHSTINNNNNNVITVLFRNPFYGENYNFLAKTLEGAVRAPRILNGKVNQKMGFKNYNQQAVLPQAGGRILNHQMPDKYQNFQRNWYHLSQQQDINSSHNNENRRYDGNQQWNTYRGSQSRANYEGDSRKNYGDQRGGNNRYQGRGGGPVHNPNTGRNYDKRRDNRQNPYPSQQGRYNNRR